MLSETEIIKRVQNLAIKLGKTPTRREYVAEYGSIAGFNLFHGYNDILIKAGLKVNHHKNLSDDEIKEMYIKYIKENGVPSSRNIPKELPSCDTIQDRFGSYRAFLKSIGYESHQKSYTKEELTKLLQDGIDNGSIKSMIDLNKPGYPSYNCFYNIFGVRTWKEILKIIDRNLESTFIPHKNYNFSKEELKNKYIELSEKIGKTKSGASKHEVRKYLGFTESVFFIAFKKPLSELRREWGYTPRKAKKIYTKEMILKALEEQEKKIGRKLTLREIVRCKELPSLPTIYITFETTSMEEIYKKRESN